jgi:hypothetical protein
MYFSPVRMVTVRTFVHNAEAEVARTVLEAAGLHAVLRRDDCGGIQPAQWMNGIELLVTEEDLDTAREILDAPTFYAARS